MPASARGLQVRIDRNKAALPEVGLKLEITGPRNHRRVRVERVPDAVRQECPQCPQCGGYLEDDAGGGCARAGCPAAVLVEASSGR